MAAYPYEILDLVNSNIVERVGSAKWIFGTDFPMPYQGRMHRMADFVDAVRALPIEDSIKEGMFHENIKSLLCGPDHKIR